jgi:plasmid replication initiation protein
MARLPGKPINEANKNFAISNIFALALNKKTLSRPAQRIEAWLISQISPTDKAFVKYRITAKDAAKVLRISQNSSYETLIKVSEELLGHVIKIVEGKQYKQYSLISSSSYHQGEGWCEIKIDPELKPYFLELQKAGGFTLLEFNITQSFKKNYTYPLYKMLKSYLHKNINDFVFDIDVLKLKEILGCSDKYNNYSNFKKSVLETSRIEIVNTSDISFEYTPKKKQWKKVISLTFHIYRKNTKPIIDANYSESKIDPLQNKLNNLGWNGDFSELVNECGYDAIKYYHDNLLITLIDDKRIKDKHDFINTQILLNAKLVYNLQPTKKVKQATSKASSKSELFDELVIIGFSGDIKAFIENVGLNNAKKALEEVKKAQQNSNIRKPGGLIRSKANLYLKQEQAKNKIKQRQEEQREKDITANKQRLSDDKEELKKVYAARVEQGISSSKDEAFTAEFNMFKIDKQNENRYLKDGTKLFDYLNNIKIKSIDDLSDEDLSLFLDWKV